MSADSHDEVQTLAAALQVWADALSARGEPDLASDLEAERVVRRLGDIGEPAAAAVPALLRAMHADPRGLGELVGPALGRIGGEVAIRELNRIWFSGWDRKLCAACYGALRTLGSRAHAVLLSASDDADPIERARVLHSLRAAGYPDAGLVALAAPLLDDTSTTVVDAAIAFISEFDDATVASPALPALRAISEDEMHFFAETRARAAELALKIARPPAGL